MKPTYRGMDGRLPDDLARVFDGVDHPGVPAPADDDQPIRCVDDDGRILGHGIFNWTGRRLNLQRATPVALRMNPGNRASQPDAWCKPHRAGVFDESAPECL